MGIGDGDWAKMKSREDFTLFFQSASKYILIIIFIDLYFPNFPGANSKFAIDVLTGTKKVSL